MRGRRIWAHAANGTSDSLPEKKIGGENVVNVGFTTHSGRVMATSNWNESAQLKQVRPALENSYELLFHGIGLPRFFLNLRDSETKNLLNRPRLERVIGVIYRPETERLSHYFDADLPEQFDGVIHFDKTRAVEPLDEAAT